MKECPGIWLMLLIWRRSIIILRLIKGDCEWRRSYEYLFNNIIKGHKSRICFVTYSEKLKMWNLKNGNCNG